MVGGRWALCGTAASHIGPLTRLLNAEAESSQMDEGAVALAAVALVHRRALRDPPSQCLPAPPLRIRDVPVPLTAEEARGRATQRMPRCA